MIGTTGLTLRAECSLGLWLCFYWLDLWPNSLSTQIRLIVHTAPRMIPLACTLWNNRLLRISNLMDCVLGFHIIAVNSVWCFILNAVNYNKYLTFHLSWYFYCSPPIGLKLYFCQMSVLTFLFFPLQNCIAVYDAWKSLLLNCTFEFKSNTIHICDHEFRRCSSWNVGVYLVDSVVSLLMRIYSFSIEDQENSHQLTYFNGD